MVTVGIARALWHLARGAKGAVQPCLVTGLSGARHTARPAELVCGRAPWALRPSCSVRRTCPA